MSTLKCLLYCTQFTTELRSASPKQGESIADATSVAVAISTERTLYCSSEYPLNVGFTVRNLQLNSDLSLEKFWTYVLQIIPK